MHQKPVLTATTHELPFTQLSWDQFERLCLRLAYKWGLQRPEHLGRAGGEQGRDIVAWDGPVLVAIQCKRVTRFAAADGEREIAKIRQLDKAERPSKLIFVVTCTVSDAARRAIRSTWSDIGDSCEFVAVSELDSEVRSDPRLLAEFFHLSSTESDIAASGGDERELRREVSLVHEWMDKTGGYYVERLLAAISEVEHPAGRLEAARTLNLAIAESGAGNRASERNVLRMCELLERNVIFQLHWRLRRMLARVVGDVFAHAVVADERLIAEYCEERLESSVGVLLLAEAATERPAAASSIGATVLERLVGSREPQAVWALLRRWPVVAPSMTRGISLETIDVADSGATQRMMLITRLLAYRSSPRELRRILEFVRDPGDPRVAALEGAFVSWAADHTSVDVRGRPAGRIVRIDQILRSAAADRRVSAELAARALELDSVERDLRNAEYGYQHHPDERFSEGRYGYTRNAVRRIIAMGLPEERSALLDALLRCADEGIRWGVAAEALVWWPTVPDRATARDIVLRLVADEHPWVVREVLQRLAEDPLLPLAIGSDELIAAAGESRDRLAERGWQTYEVTAALGRL